MDIQVILALIGFAQAVTLAIFGWVTTRDAKERKKVEAISRQHAENMESRAELRKQESLHSMKVNSACLGLSIATAAALKEGHSNGRLTAALDRAAETQAEYDDFIQKAAIGIISEGSK